jgi:Sel1 repeat
MAKHRPEAEAALQALSTMETYPARSVRCCLSNLAASAFIIVFFFIAAQNSFTQNNISSDSARENALRQKAERGDSEAALELGERYESRPQPDYAEALRWYHKSADEGNVAARIQIGEMYLDGRGVAQDYIEAARWYRCPKLDAKIVASCPNAPVTPLPREARKLVRELPWCDANDKYGTAIGLSENGVATYTTCCHEFPHGECEAVLIGKVDGVWKDFTGPGLLGDGWMCGQFLPLESKHGDFHDVCLPDVCSPGSWGKSCPPTIWQFRDGRYRTAPASGADRPAK